MNIYNRVLSVILSLALIFAIVPVSAFSVFAESPVYNPVEFTVTGAKGVENKTVVAEVRVTENSQIASLTLELAFDSSKLLVKDFQAGDLLANGLSAINGNISDKVILSYASMEPITRAGTLFSVEFQVTADVNDILDLSVNVTEATDLNGDDLEIAGEQPGTVEVVDLLYGDLNFDNRITAVDALMVLSALTEETSLSQEAKKAADVNGDNRVSVSDALQILYFSAEVVTDFSIYNLTPPDNVHVADLDGYQFTVEWDYSKDVLGYNVYLDGEKVNEELLTKNSVSIGVNMAGEYGDETIPHRIQDRIEQVTDYNIEITAVNALKESEKCDICKVTTKRIWSWVTFNDWDGTQIKKSRVYYGEDAVVPNDPIRTDYFFTGWDKPTTNIIDDTVITATYEDAHYNFIFRNEDGAELYRQDVTVNGKATPPADPQKTGYTFSGWYTQAEGGEKITDFSVTSQTGERIAYARYTINTYTVSFDSRGGSSVTSKSTVYMTGIAAPAAPTRLGFGFGGWYKEPGCYNKWNFDRDVLTGDTILYAKWNPVTITIDKASVTLNSVGATAQLNATVTGGTDQISWYSDNTNVVTVSAGGLLTAKGHGTATIYVKGAASERRPVTKVTVNVAKDAWIAEEGGMYLYSKPDASSTALTLIPFRTQVTVYGAGEIGWIYAKYGNAYGYLPTAYIAYSQPAPKPASGTFKQKLEKLKALYPEGSPWVGGADGYGMYVGYYNGTYGQGSVNGWSCYSFAIIAYIEMNGHSPQIVAKSANYSDIRVGDVIYFVDHYWYNGVWTASGHYIFISDIDANGVWAAEGNCGNQVRYTNYRRFGVELTDIMEIRR